MSADDATIRIRRYPNRRLYDRSRGRYVTLHDIEQLVLGGRTIEVTDSRNDDDITRQILTQILSERHPRKLDMFPIAMLHSIVRANDLVFDFWQSHFRALLAAMDGVPAPAPAFPAPMEWLSTFVPGAMTPPSPSAATPNPPDATALRVAELEDRLRRLEAQNAQAPPPERPARPPKRQAKSRKSPRRG